MYCCTAYICVVDTMYTYSIALPWFVASVRCDMSLYYPTELPPNHPTLMYLMFYAISCSTHLIPRVHPTSPTRTYFSNWRTNVPVTPRVQHPTYPSYPVLNACDPAN
jgi:hypothetical protein